MDNIANALKSSFSFKAGTEASTDKSDGKIEINTDKGVDDPKSLEKKEGATKRQLKKGAAKLGSWKKDFTANFKSGPMQNMGDIVGTSLSSAFWFVGAIFTVLGLISLPFLIVVTVTYTVLKYLLSFFSGL